MASETTPLTSGEESRTYLFLSQRHRSRRTKIRQFQCCVCAAMLGIFVTAMVITVSYSMNHDPADESTNNETGAKEMEVLPTGGQQTLNTLLALSWPLPEKKQPSWKGPIPSDLEIAAALEEGEARLKAKDRMETLARFQTNNTVSPGILQLGTPSYMHQQSIKTTPEAIKAARVGYVIGVATKKLASKNLIPKGSVGQGPEVHAYWLPTGMTCDNGTTREMLNESTECLPSPYRTMDGTCNNLVHPEWGVAMRPFRRMLPPDYADGISAPRLAKDGSPLPSARDVSLTIHRPIYRNDPKFTVMLAVWGQFFDHDITATALSKSKDAAPIACCTEDGKLPTVEMHPECYPVVLSAEDPYYSKFGRTCMEFIRSAPSPTCHFGPREQLNQITSYIDGSVVYGSSEEQAMRLKSPNGKGELHMMVTPDGRELLPPSTDPRDGCNTPEMNQKGKYCFMSGDARANENMHLTTMHLLMAREHNRVVRALSQINPSWDDERLYQEGRRIVAAEIQHITYNEFLPVVLGQSLMDRLKLSPEKDGYFEGYDPDVNPAVANNFATAAFRFAHTLLPTLMKILRNDTSSEEYVELHKMLFNPYILYYPEQMDNAINGALSTDIQRVDTYLTPEVTQHLFQQRWSEDYDKAQEKNNKESGKIRKKKGYGLDLASLNIQRGRDHGLPSYPNWRQFCGMSSPKSFSDLQGQMDEAALQRLATIFKSVDDVDMYSGSLSEVPIGEGLLGPTFSCLIADQFLRLKIGDRYWYETSQQPQAFTPDQLNEIRKTSLASIICDNSGVDHAQPRVMRTVDASNPRMPCTSIPHIQMEAWRDKSMIGHVKISTSSVNPRVMSKPHNLEEIPSSNKAMASMFIKGTVISASVMATDSDGSHITVLGPSSSFPKEIPLHLFDEKVNDTKFDYSGDLIPTIYHGGGGVTWTGALTSTGPMQARLKGNFTVPFFKHGSIPFDFSISSYIGDFDITMNLVENTTFGMLQNLQGTYNSGIYYQVEYDSTNLSLIKESLEEESAKSSSPVSQAPLLLYGSYSVDRMKFYWNGNISLILPSPSIPTLTESDNEMKKKTKSKSSSISVEVTATWGMVTAVSGPASRNGRSGSKTVITTWWDGSFPVPIPQPAFDRMASNDSQTVLSLINTLNPGDGVTWSGSFSGVTGSTTGDVQLNGTYSFPVFMHGQKGKSGELSVFAEKFWRGNFSMVFRPSLVYQATPLISLLHVLSSRGPFKSPIFFKTINNIEETAPPRDFSGDAISIVPIILHGYTSLDKSIFFWTGNATISVPMSTINDKIDKTKIGDESSLQTSRIIKASKDFSIPLNLKIFSASVNITISTSSSTPEKNISWNGEFPVTIPQPAFYHSSSPQSLKAQIDDYPYSPLAKPAAKPSKYKSEISWSKLSASFVNSSTTEIQVNGSFSFPIFYFGDAVMGFWEGPMVERWNGDFSGTFHYDSPTKNIDAIDSFLAIITGSYLKSSVYFIEESKVEDDGTYLENLKKTDSKISDQMELSIILRGTKSPDKTQFYWNGDATLLIPLLISKGNVGHELKAISKTKVVNGSYLSGTVVSGNIIASSSAGKVMWWNGELPLPIAMPAFDSVSPNAGVYTWPYDPPFYNGTGGVTWFGSMIKTSMVKNGITVKGSFNLPVFVHGNPSAFEVIEWDGDFSLQISINVNRSGAQSPLAEGKYNSPVFFREHNSKLLSNEEAINQIQELMESSSSSYLTSPADHAVRRVPLILWGNYSDESKTFYWQGNISAIFPSVRNYLSSSSEPFAKETWMKSEASELKKVRMSIKVISGSLTASSASFSDKELWDGTLPFTLQPSVFENFSKEYSFIGGPITWTGHFALADSLENGAHLEGTFSIPMLVHRNTSTLSFETWTGDFSFLIVFEKSVIVKDLLPTTGSFKSRIRLCVTEPTLLESNTESKGNDPMEMTVNDLMESISWSDPSSYSTLYVPVVLLGQFSMDKKTFTWNGEALTYLPHNPPTHSNVLGGSNINIQSSFEPQSPILRKSTRQTIFGYVTSGRVSGGAQGYPTGTLWDGSFPANIPMTAFDGFSNSSEELDESIPLSQQTGGGITWKIAAVSSKAGVIQIRGNFFFPVNTHGQLHTFSITIWKGEFSFNAILPGDQSIKIPKEEVRYRSLIYFHHSRSKWDPFKLNENLASIEGSRDMSYYLRANLGKKATEKTAIIILKGTRDKATFFWSGKFVLVFPNY